MYEPYQPISVFSPTRRETPFYASSSATVMIWGAHLALFGPLRTLYNFVVTGAAARICDIRDRLLRRQAGRMSSCLSPIPVSSVRTWSGSPAVVTLG